MARPTNDDHAEAIQRVMDRIKPASEINDHLRALVYAYPKKGKTRFCATAPGVLLLDVNEKGTASVRRDTNPAVFPVARWNDFNDVYWFLASGDHPYKTWAIDGITSMQTLCMNFVLGEAHALDASRDPDLPRGPIYQKAAQLMKTQITNFRNLEMHGIFTALTRTRSAGDDEDDDSGEVMITPNCMPSVAAHLEAAVDIIGYLTVKEVWVKNTKKKTRRQVKRTTMMVDNNVRFITGDRTFLFGERIDSPNMAEMITAYTSDRGE